MLSERNKKGRLFHWKVVLILVVVEYALWDLSQHERLTWSLRVLILVVVEYALWVTTKSLKIISKLSLNPCCSGTCSLRSPPTTTTPRYSWVLILVVVEYALWASIDLRKTLINIVLILVVVEYALWVYTPSGMVLILVVVEYALWAESNGHQGQTSYTS